MNEITTDRATALKKRELKKNNSYGQKISTEANDGLSLNRKQKEYIINENTTNRYVFTNDDNYEMNERIDVLKQIVDNAAKLNIEVMINKTSQVINSSILPQGLVFKINAQGLDGSLRCKKDGIVYFGYQEELISVKYF